MVPSGSPGYRGGSVLSQGLFLVPDRHWSLVLGQLWRVLLVSFSIQLPWEEVPLLVTVGV